MPHFHFPIEVLQESYSHMLKWPGITANLSSKATAPLLSPLITFICYPLPLTISWGEILSAGISLKSEDWRTQVIIRVSQLGVIQIQREGQCCRKGSNSQDKSLVTTTVCLQMLGLSPREREHSTLQVRLGSQQAGCGTLIKRTVCSDNDDAHIGDFPFGIDEITMPLVCHQFPP